VWRTAQQRGREPFLLTPGLRLERLPAVRGGWDMYAVHAFAWMRAMAQAVARHRRDWSAALVIDSGIASHWFYECCRRAGIPTAAYIRGNARTSLENVDRYRHGTRRLYRWAMRWWYPWSESRMARSSPVVIDNDLLAADLKLKGADVRMIVAALARRHHVVSQPPEPSIQPQPLRICWVGRMVRLKGLHVLLDALSQLARAGIAFEVDLIGPGDADYVRELQASSNAPELRGKVRFPGAVPWGDALFEYLDRAELFVLPSFTEGTPKSVTDAMARGLVVIASRVGGIARLVEDGNTGFLVAPQGAKELFERLHLLALDPGLRRRLAVSTLKKVRGLTLDEQLPILVKAMLDAAARKSTEVGVAV